MGTVRIVLSKLILPVYLPCLLVNGGTAMLVPILPLYLASNGLSNTNVGIVIAGAGLGGMLSQIPFGRALEKFSETRVMVVAVALIAAAVVSLGFVAAAVALATLRLVGGIGSTGWLLSRQTFLTRVVDPSVRGRAMAVFGGTTRSAFLIGPLTSGLVADQLGFRAAFGASAAATLLGIVPLLMWERHNPEPERDTAPSTRRVARPSLRGDSRSLATAGTGQLLVVTVRQGRFVVLPLVGAAIGMSATEVGVLISIGGFADLLLFPVSGLVMDRFGRLAAIIPSFGLIGVGLFVLSAAETASMLAVAAVIIGIGNGMGSGTMLTLSADLAPIESPSGFLAALGTIRDAGRISGPLLVGAIADLAGLSWSSIVLGALSFLAVAVIVVGVGETKGTHAQAVERRIGGLSR